MENIKHSGRSPVIGEALRRAREAEAAHYEARLAFNDAKLLRLSALWDDIAEDFQAGASQAELNVSHDGEPRLWIDLVTSVVMAPDPATYRLIRDGEAGRETLLETASRAEMADCIRRYVSHLAIAAARKTDSTIVPPEIAQRSSGEPLLAFAVGIAAGAAAVLTLINFMKL